MKAKLFTKDMVFIDVIDISQLSFKRQRNKEYTISCKPIADKDYNWEQVSFIYFLDDNEEKTKRIQYKPCGYLEGYNGESLSIKSMESYLESISVIPENFEWWQNKLLKNVLPDLCYGFRRIKKASLSEMQDVATSYHVKFDVLENGNGEVYADTGYYFSPSNTHELYYYSDGYVIYRITLPEEARRQGLVLRWSDQTGTTTDVSVQFRWSNVSSDFTGTYSAEQSPLRGEGSRKNETVGVDVPESDNTYLFIKFNLKYDTGSTSVFPKGYNYEQEITTVQGEGEENYVYYGKTAILNAFEIIYRVDTRIEEGTISVSDTQLMQADLSNCSSLLSVLKAISEAYKLTFFVSFEENIPLLNVYNEYINDTTNQTIITDKVNSTVTRKEIKTETLQAVEAFGIGNGFDRIHAFVKADDLEANIKNIGKYEGEETSVEDLVTNAKAYIEKENEELSSASFEYYNMPLQVNDKVRVVINKNVYTSLITEENYSFDGDKTKKEYTIGIRKYAFSGFFTSPFSGLFLYKPEAPTNLIATRMEQGWNVSWQGRTQRYILQYRRSSTSPWNTISVTGTNCTIPFTEYDIDYTFAIYAVDDRGQYSDAMYIYSNSSSEVIYSWETYNDSDSQPDTPTGEGNADGWHRDLTQEAKWMSKKESHRITEGTWSVPVLMPGAVKDGISTDIPDNVTGLTSVAMRDGIQIRCNSLSGGTKNIVNKYNFELLLEGSSTWISISSDTNSAFYTFDRSTIGYPEASEIDGSQVRCKVTNVYGYASLSYATATVSIVGYGTWIPVKPSSLSIVAQEKTLTLGFNQVDGSNYYGSTIYTVKLSYSGTTRVEKSGLREKFYVYDFNRAVDGYPEKTVITGKPYLGNYSLIVTAKDIVSGKTNISNTSATLDTSNYGTWIPTAPTIFNVQSGNRSIVLGWQIPLSSGIYIYGLRFYEIQISKDGTNWYKPETTKTGKVLESDWYNGTGQVRVSGVQFAQSLPLTGQTSGLPENTTYYYRVRTIGVTDSYISAWSTAQTGIALATGIGDIVGKSVKEAQLDDSSVTIDKLKDGAVTNIKIKNSTIEMAKFATGIRPPRVVDTLPVTPFVGYENGDTIVLTTDSKLYRFNGTGFTKEVDGLDIIANTVTTGAIKAGAIGVDQLASGSGINLVPYDKASFENYAEGFVPEWSRASGVTFSITTEKALDGAKSLKMTYTTGETFLYIGAMNVYDILIEAGKKYIISAYVFATNTLSMRIGIRKNNGTVVVIKDDTTDVNKWKRVYGSYTAVAGDTSLNLILYLMNSGTMYVDAWQVEEVHSDGSQPSPYRSPGLTTIEGGLIKTGTILSDQIKTDAVTTEKIKAGAIITEKIASDAVTTEKLHVLARNKINNFSITGTLEGWTTTGTLEDDVSGFKKLRFTGGGFLSNAFTVQPNEICSFEFGISCPNYTSNSGAFIGLTAGQNFKNYQWSFTLNKWTAGTVSTSQYFILNYIATTVKYFKTYILGSNVSINDIPAPSATDTVHPIRALQLQGTDTTARLRTGFDPITTGTYWEIYNPQIYSNQGGKVVAQQIITPALSAINANVGEITSGILRAIVKPGESKPNVFLDLDTEEFRVGNNPSLEDSNHANAEYLHWKPNQGLFLKLKNLIVDALASTIRGRFRVRGTTAEMAQSVLIVNPESTEDPDTNTPANTTVIKTALQCPAGVTGNLTGNVTGNVTGKASDSYPIPTDAVLQYSFDEIKQLPDNPAGTVYKRDNDWTTNDGWVASESSSTLSISGGVLVVTPSGTVPYCAVAKTGNYAGKKVAVITRKTTGTVKIQVRKGLDYYDIVNFTQEKGENRILIYAITPSDSDYVRIYCSNAETFYVETVYIGDGSYLDPVIDNSYSEAHAENHGVIPVDGVCGKAGYFNNSYMIAPRPALGDDITIYFWAKFDALGTQTIVQSRTVLASGLSVFLIDSFYRLDYRGNIATLTGYTPSVNTWHHVCLKKNATTTVLKINGELKSTLTGTYGTTTNLASTIWSGLSGTGGTLSGNILTGALDGLKIVPRFTTNDEDTGEYKARANHPKFYATADKWKTARNITISDADGTNTGTAVSVDGSENETLKLPATIKADLTGNASTATLATQANAIKPLGNSITFPASSTSVTKIIKIATVNWNYSGSFNLTCMGSSIDETIKAELFGGFATNTGIRVLYGKVNTIYGIKNIIVTLDTPTWNSNRQIYAEIVTVSTYNSTTSLGVVETNRGTFTPSMTEVSSVEGTVVDSLSLSYLRGDISSYQHVFTKNIIGNLTGNVTGNVSGSSSNVNSTNFFLNEDDNDVKLHSKNGKDLWLNATNAKGFIYADELNLGNAGQKVGILTRNTSMHQPDSTYPVSIGGNVHMNNKIIEYASELHCSDNGQGSLYISTKKGALTGFPNDYHPTIRTSGEELNFDIADTYAFTIGSSNGSTYIDAGTNTKLVSDSPFYGAVGNDICDNLKIDSPVKNFEYGYCYCEDKGEYRKGNRGIIGITSDTASLHCGSDDGMEAGKDYLPIAIGGFVLAFVDKKYRRGTPLKAKKDGSLTLAFWWTPCWKIMATYQEEPKEETWNKAKVNGRVIVRVK